MAHFQNSSNVRAYENLIMPLDRFDQRLLLVEEWARSMIAMASWAGRKFAFGVWSFYRHTTPLTRWIRFRILIRLNSNVDTEKFCRWSVYSQTASMLDVKRSRKMIPKRKTKTTQICQDLEFHLHQLPWLNLLSWVPEVCLLPRRGWWLSATFWMSGISIKDLIRFNFKFDWNHLYRHKAL
jgi:hypothetical protein